MSINKNTQALADLLGVSRAKKETKPKETVNSLTCGLTDQTTALAIDLISRGVITGGTPAEKMANAMARAQKEISESTAPVGRLQKSYVNRVGLNNSNYQGEKPEVTVKDRVQAAEDFLRS